MSATPTHHEPIAPLRHLVRTLHQGRTLAQNVTRLRFKRKRAKPAAPPEAQP